MTKGQQADHRKVDSSLSLSLSSSSERKEDENKNFENNENNPGVEENVEKEEETSNDANVVLDPAGVGRQPGVLCLGRREQRFEHGRGWQHPRERYAVWQAAAEGIPGSRLPQRLGPCRLPRGASPEPVLTVLRLKQSGAAGPSCRHALRDDVAGQNRAQGALRVAK